MIRKRVVKQLNAQLPAYINSTLNPVQQRMIELWLKRDEEARLTAKNLKALQTAVNRQPRRAPPPTVLDKIQAQIRSQQPTAARPIIQTMPKAAIGFPILLLSLVTLILALIVTWQAMPPGIILQWSVQGREPEAFRVYRAEARSGEAVADSQFELIRELPAANQERNYTFVDFRMWPGQNYVYRVEGLNATGQPAASQTITGQAIDALPGQLVMLLALLFAGYCFWSMIRLRRPITATPI